jgi:hypothetical protein
MHMLPESAFDTQDLPLYGFSSLLVMSYQIKSGGQTKSKEEVK